MPVASANRSLTQVSIEQAGIGQTDIVLAAGLVGAKVYVCTIVLTFSAAGGLQFNEGVGPTALTGVLPVAINGGFVVGEGGGSEPVLQTLTAGSKFGLVTTGAGCTAHGWIRYFIDT
jgi:hypothetical protein